MRERDAREGRAVRDARDAAEGPPMSDCGEGRAAFSETRRGAFAFGTTTSVGSKFRASTMFTELGSMLLAKWGAGRTAVVDGRAARK